MMGVMVEDKGEEDLIVHQIIANTAAGRECFSSPLQYRHGSKK